MRSVALVALLPSLLASSPATAQVNASDMRSGCLSWTAVQGLVSSPLFVVPTGFRFVLTDVSIARVAAGGPITTGGEGIRISINLGGTTSVPRWIGTDRLTSTDPPLQVHWNTGIVFEENEIVEGAATVVNGPAPCVTICWSGYLTPTSTSSVIPGPPASGDLALEVTPNPAREGSELLFTTSKRQRVTVGVFAVDGRRVRVLQRGMLEAGEHRLTWDGRDDQGRLLASGLYFAKVDTEIGSTTKRIARVR
jgi:hypothetical protein